MNIALLLGLPEHTLKAIEAEQSTQINRLREGLSLWLKQVEPYPTWSSLAKAVKLFHPKKADEIKEISIGFSLDNW